MAKIKKKTIRLFSIFLFAIVVLIFTFNGIVAKIIEHKMDDFLVNEHLEHYHIEYRRIGFNFLNRSITLKDFKYLPDSIFLDSLAKSNLNTMVPEITVRSVTVAGINFQELIKNRNLLIRKITVKSPLIKLYKFNGRLPTEKSEKKRSLHINDSIKIHGLKGLSVGTISFKRSQFEIYNYKQKKYTLSSKNIKISLHKLVLESSNHGNAYFYPTLHDASLIAKNNVLKLGNKLYEIAFQQLTIDLKGESLIFNGFHFKPLYSKEAFSKHIKFQKERFNMKAKEIAFTGADFYRFLTENEIRIRKITILDGFINLYRDKRVPFNHKQRPLLPNQALKKIKGKLKIDTIDIKNIRFDYGELTDVRSQPLSIYFTDLSGTITHISNFPYLWRRNSMKMTITGKLMKKAPLRLQFVFPLAAKSDTFSFSGTVYGPVPFTVFNPSIYPAAGLKFDKGILNKLSFSGSANPMYSSGTMTMLYHDLDLQAMKKKDGQTANKFLSWGVNSLLRKNNPRKGEGKQAKSAVMFFQRDIEKGFGNFFWKTLFSGMKATMLPSVNSINKKNMQSITKGSSTAGKKK